MDITLTQTTNAQWTRLVEEYMQKSEPIINVHRDDKRKYNAIFVGGGAEGGLVQAICALLGGDSLS